MFIKWKYNDHGHPDFRELEVPDDLDGYESVEEWICEAGLVPTWSERFFAGRIKWEKLDKPSRDYVINRISGLKMEIGWRQQKIAELEELLKGLTE